MWTTWQCSGRGRRGAFTLIEIMIVVGLIAVVTAMGMPAFVQMIRKEPLRKAVSDIVEACKKAREWAILKGIPTEVTIQATDGHITVAPVGTNSVEQTEMNAPDAVDQVASIASPESIFSARLHDDVAVTLLYVNLKNQMEAEQTRVRFYPNGTSDEFTIVVETGSGVRKISLECVTGLSSVEAIR